MISNLMTTWEQKIVTCSMCAQKKGGQYKFYIKLFIYKIIYLYK